MPTHKEIKILRYLNTVETRYDNNKRGDTEKNIKERLGITEGDIGDMHYSEYLHFSSVLVNPGRIVEPIICITHKGSVFIENYRYEKMKEIFFWIFGLSATVAAIYGILAFYCK